MSNIFQNIPSSLPEELVEVLIDAKNITVERIISNGQVTAKDEWLVSLQSEWVLVLQGEGHLRFENGEIKKMKKGDYILIDANKKHQVCYTSIQEATIWLTIYFNK